MTLFDFPVGKQIPKAREILRLPPAPSNDPLQAEKLKPEAARRELSTALERASPVLSEPAAPNGAPPKKAADKATRCGSRQAGRRRPSRADCRADQSSIHPHRDGPPSDSPPKPAGADAMSLNANQLAESLGGENGAAAVVPVDWFIPGCPPHPLTIFEGLLRVLERLE